MLSGLQVLRAVAALSVVFFHIYIWEHKVLGEKSVTGSFFGAGEYGVDLFFVISGFVMVFITRSPLSSARLFFEFLYLRVVRIYPPYLIITLVLTFIWLVKPTLFNNAYGNRVEIIRSYFLLPQHATPLLSVGWTLIHEQWFYLVVSIALIFSRKGRIIFGGIWFTLVLIVFINIPDLGTPFLKLIFSPFSLTFLLGYFIGLSKDLIPQNGPLGLALLLAGIAGFAFGTSHIPFVGLYPDNNNMVRFLYSGVPCAAITMSFLMLERVFNSGWKFLILLGNASYSLYLVHIPVLVFLYKIPPLIGSFNPVLSSAFAAFAALACIAVALAFHLNIELPILAFARKGRARLF